MTEVRSQRQTIRDFVFHEGDLVLVKNLRVPDSTNKHYSIFFANLHDPYVIINCEVKIFYHIQKREVGPVRDFNLRNLMPYHQLDIVFLEYLLW